MEKRCRGAGAEHQQPMHSSDDAADTDDAAAALAALEQEAAQRIRAQSCQSETHVTKCITLESVPQEAYLR